MMETLMVSFYGDDFTGSTDVMESLSLNGVPAALFLHPPTQEEVKAFRLKNSHVSPDGRLKAFGIPGISRSLSPAQMDQELPGVFEKLAKIPSQYFHYKICSTFDSSPHIGNIGHAVDIALKYFPSHFMPLVVAVPLLNRFCVFGNLFARVDDVTYRIDRHPTMSKHPVTPMNEADLRLHLSQQTSKPVHSIDINHLADIEVSMSRYTDHARAGGFILFDVLTTNHLRQIGKIIENNKNKEHQLLVGSSGVEYALCNHWQETGRVSKQIIPTHTEKTQRYMVICGSCSPTTARQISYGLSIGYKGIRLDSIKLVDNPSEEIQRCVAESLEIINAGGVPLLYSAVGPDDPYIETTRLKIKSIGDGENVGARLGNAQGEILKTILDTVGKLRVTVAGGDTSGFVSKKLGIYALEVLIPMAPGAPLCLAHSSDKKYDGLEISLKGGQNGTNRFFENVQLGSTEQIPEMTKN